MTWLGYRAEDSTIEVYFTTHEAAGGVVAPSSAFEAADVAIYKNGSATQKTATDGLTMTSPFDSETGLHLLQIDTSDDTNDAGFWVTGGRYMVYLTPDETVDSQTVGAVIAEFILGPAPANLTQWKGTVPADLTDTDKVQVSVQHPATLLLAANSMLPGTVNDANTTPTTTVFAADDITEATADHFNGRLIVFTSGALLREYCKITDYELDTGEGKFTVETEGGGTLTDTPADGDTFLIV